MADQRLLLSSVIDRFPAIEPRSWQLSVLREAWDEPIGIWEILACAREEVPRLERDGLLAALAGLMALGLLEAGVPTADGNFEKWPGTQREVLARIEREWVELGRDPWLGDIVYLALSPAGLELAEAWPLLRFADEPRDDLYRSLLEWLIPHAAQFVVVVREEGIPKSQSVRDRLALFRNWRIGEEPTPHWPGMSLLSGTAILVRHRYDALALEPLFRVAGGPFDWVHPHLPEALSFLDPSGRALLINNPHDRTLSLDLSPGELSDLRERAPKIAPLLESVWKVEREMHGHS